jgi:hypothetical protein
MATTAPVRPNTDDTDPLHPVPLTTPEVLTIKHWVDPVRKPKVMPVANVGEAVQAALPDVSSWNSPIAEPPELPLKHAHEDAELSHTATVPVMDGEHPERPEAAVAKEACVAVAALPVVLDVMLAGIEDSGMVPDHVRANVPFAVRVGGVTASPVGTVRVMLEMPPPPPPDGAQLPTEDVRQVSRWVVELAYQRS